MRTLQQTTTPDPAALVAKTVPEAPARKPRQSPGEHGERYAGMKKMLIPIDPELHRKLRMMALARDGGTLEKIVQEACAEYVERYGRQ